MQAIIKALDSIPALVWAERAMGFHGVSTVVEHHVLIIDDLNLQQAIQKLREAGFPDSPWSFGTRYPEFDDCPVKQRIYYRLVKEFANVDRVSARFLLPAELQDFRGALKLVLLPSSYAHMPIEHPSNKEMGWRGSNIYLPSAARLVQSFVQILVREPVAGAWTRMLGYWSVTYLWGQLMLDDGILDSCDDEKAKDWFNEEIRRFTGGLDRITCTKRLGRVGYDERLARIP